MGLRGPKKKPTVLNELHGRPGHGKINRREPKPGGNLHTPPSWMSKEQKAEWTKIVGNCVPGLLTSVDESNLTTFVVAVCLHRAAAITLGRLKDLAVPVGPNGAIQQHPALQVVNRQALIILKAAAEMGFTPASRTRIQVNGDIPPPVAKPSKTVSQPGGLAAFAGLNPDNKHAN